MISINNITKKFENNLVLDGLNLELQKGDFATIVGQSGAGKSTLLNILGLLSSPDKGEYLFENQNTATMSAKQLQEFRSKSVSFVFQNFYLLEELTVMNNICLPLIFEGIDKLEREKMATELAKDLGIEDKLLEYPNTLSGGQTQRVAIARALITAPKLLLADEPTGNLDWDNRQEVAKILTKINQKGTTIILITHDRDLAKIGNKKFELKNGKLVSLV